jgi:hypothetical protein
MGTFLQAGASPNAISLRFERRSDMKPIRPIMNHKLLMFSLFCWMTVAMASASAAGEVLPKITLTASTGQKAFTWVKVDAGNTVVETGVTIPFEVIEKPPSQTGKGPAGSIVVLPFPAVVRASTFLNHFELNWEKDGHEPKVFMVPHFDFHFYSVPAAEVYQVTAQDPLPPEAKKIPTGFVYPGGQYSVPQMGVHAFRPADLEKPFSDVLIYGFYGGKMTFIEPMVTRTRLLEKQAISYDIPVPGSLGSSTRYPTKVDIRYDAKINCYHVIFSRFITATA